jgi:SMC interacting uncharacterized protein involved in chromosome segregation
LSDIKLFYHKGEEKRTSKGVKYDGLMKRMERGIREKEEEIKVHKGERRGGDKGTQVRKEGRMG